MLCLPKKQHGRLLRGLGEGSNDEVTSLLDLVKAGRCHEQCQHESLFRLKVAVRQTNVFIECVQSAGAFLFRVQASFAAATLAAMQIS